MITKVIEIGEEGEVHERGESQWTIDAIDFLRACLTNVLNDACEIARKRDLHFEAHGVGKLAGRENVFHFAGQIDRVFFLDGDVSIAGDPETSRGSDFLTGEDTPRMRGNDLL